MSAKLAAAFALALLLPQQVPVPAPPRGFGTTEADVVVDSAHVLSPQAIQLMDRIAFDVHRKSGGEIAIVTLPDLGGRDVAEVALRIGRSWGVGAATAIGQASRNAGALILLVPKETSADGRGHIRIETGRGTEGFIPDAVAGDMIRAATPYFQRQEYDGGMLLITALVARHYAGEFGFTLDTAVVPAPAAPSEAPVTVPPGVVVFLLVVFFLILSGLMNASRRGANRGGGNGCLWFLLGMALSGPRRRGPWGGGGFGGGSFGGGGGFGGFGGGGGFSGGGSSGSW